jgi:hypothetical protein
MELKSLAGRVGVGCNSLCKYHRMARKAMPRKTHTLPVASNWMVTGDIPGSASTWLAEAPTMVSCTGGGGDWSCSSSRMAGILDNARRAGAQFWPGGRPWLDGFRCGRAAQRHLPSRVVTIFGLDLYLIASHRYPALPFLGEKGVLAKTYTTGAWLGKFVESSGNMSVFPEIIGGLLCV